MCVYLIGNEVHIELTFFLYSIKLIPSNQLFQLIIISNYSFNHLINFILPIDINTHFY